MIYAGNFETEIGSDILRAFRGEEHTFLAQADVHLFSEAFNLKATHFLLSPREQPQCITKLIMEHSVSRRFSAKWIFKRNWGDTQGGVSHAWDASRMLVNC
jgi:hypothetical protein